jgi:predicted anti-sigma-YlaC factor YlaD
MNGDSYSPGGVKNNTMAVTSVVSAIIAWAVGVLVGCLLFFVFTPLTLCTGLVFLLGNLVAVITGYMARDQIRKSQEGGAGMAQTGLILGMSGLGLSLLLVCFFFIAGAGGLALMGPQIGNVFSQINSDLSTPVP